MNWLNRIVVCCECNRPTLDSIMAAGFAVARVEHGSLPKAPSFVRPLVTGSANAPVPAPWSIEQTGFFQCPSHGKQWSGPLTRASRPSESNLQHSSEEGLR